MEMWTGHSHLTLARVIKLPATILTQINLFQKKNRFGDVGQAFRDQLLKNKVWKETEKKNQNITPYSLRHRFVHQCHKGSNNPISIKDAAVGHTVGTHMNNYGSYATDLAIEKAFERHAENRIEV